jgi:hypothetical protein
MVNKLLKLTNHNRLWLTFAFVVGLIRVWLEYQPESLSFWIGAVLTGVAATVAAAAALELLDKYSERLAALATFLIVVSVSLFNPLSVTIAVFLFSSPVVGSKYISKYGFASDIQKRVKLSRFASSRSRIPFPSVASMFARRHGPYALHSLSCCLLN